MMQHELMYVEMIYAFLCIYVNRGITDITTTPALSQCTARIKHSSHLLRFPCPVTETDTERLQGPKLIKSLIADCKYSMQDSCRRGCVPCQSEAGCS